MRIAVFQFGSNENINNNFNAIKRAVTQAYENKVRLLVFHECAICGYPPRETDINKINFDVLNNCIKEIEQLAKKYDMYIAVGTIRRIESKNYNSITLINPHGEIVGNYDKRALLGCDSDNFVNGNSLGVYEIDNIKIGFRICSEARFPECFRELYKAKAELCFVCLSDVSDNDLIGKYELVKSALRTRAADNVITVVSINSSSKYQTAPTAVFEWNGEMIKEAKKNEEYLLVYDYDPPEISYRARSGLQNFIDAFNL
jgi:predicted amidohydrolase